MYHDKIAMIEEEGKKRGKKRGVRRVRKEE